MACKWPLSATAYSASTTTKLSSSILFTFDLSPSKRHLTTFSLHNNSFSSPTSFRCSLNSGVKLQKSTNSVVCSASNQKKQNLNFKTLLGKKYLWRRILFASRKVRSIILLNVITIVYASNIPVVKEVEAIMDPAAFTVVRFVVTAIPFVPFALQSWDDVQTRNAGIELGFWVSLGYLMQALGLLTSDAGRASFISMFTVIVVPLLDGMLGAIVPAHTWFGAIMSIIGVAMLESSGSPPSIGDLLNFLSAVFFGVHMLRTEHISRSTNKKNFLPLLGYEVCVIAISSTAWYFAGGWFGGVQTFDPPSWTWEMVWHWMAVFPWIPALYTGIFSTGLCLWIEMGAMRDVSATETAIIYGLEPVWGAGFAWFLLGERWGATGWIGAALVLGCCTGFKKLNIAFCLSWLGIAKCGYHHYLAIAILKTRTGMSGSLMVQTFGSLSSGVSGKEEERKSERVDHLLVSEKQNGFSAPVRVSSRKEVPNVLKK